MSAPTPSPSGPPRRERAAAGVFVGATSMDHIYLIDQPVGTNGRQCARRHLSVAGGNATNAAVAFAALGGEATLVTAIGTGPVADAVRAELAGRGLHVIDTAAADPCGPVVSSCMVWSVTGERSIVSSGAPHQPSESGCELMSGLLSDADVVVLDSYQPSLTLPAARNARALGVPVIFDVDRWDSGTVDLLGQVDLALCSAELVVPGRADVLGAVLAGGPSFAALLAGGSPVSWRSSTGRGHLGVPAVRVVDTTGAGDILAGAFAYAFAAGRQAGAALRAQEAVDALAFGVQVASASCTRFGTRDWILDLPPRA